MSFFRKKHSVTVASHVVLEDMWEGGNEGTRNDISKLFSSLPGPLSSLPPVPSGGGDENLVISVALGESAPFLPR